MNRIEKRFRELARKGRKAFIAYVTAGDPSLAMTERIVPALERSGVDIVELGIPFSDPLADGPTIQAASQRALRGKATLRRIFKSVKALRGHTDIPIAFMTYYNPVLRYGLRRFIKDCRRNGVDGVIVPDLPCEEAKDLVRLGKMDDIATIFLAAPTSTRDRLRDIAKNSRGFIYYVSLTGVTGARKKLPEEIKSKVTLIKSMTKKPVCVGFGVSNPTQAKELAEVSDGVIVGSALVKIIGERGDIVSRASKFASNLARAIHSV